MQRPNWLTEATHSSTKESTMPDADNASLDADIADMLDDSRWTDLPDVDQHSSWDSQAWSLFDTDLGSLPSTDLLGSDKALDIDLFATEKLDDAVPDFELALLMADVNTNFTSAPDTQQDMDASANNINVAESLLPQPDQHRSCTPVSRGTGQQSSCKSDLFHLVSLPITFDAILFPAFCMSNLTSSS